MSGGSNYLDGEENLYGLPSPLPSGASEQASAIVDMELKRPEGIVYTVDKNGNPAFMRALIPSFTYVLGGAIAPGTNVTVTVTPGVRQDLIGEVLILEKENPDALEAVVVSAVSGTNQITLAKVQFNHASGTKADTGMIITEERNLPAKRSIARYSRFPCASILSLMGRYGYGRRTDQISGMFQDANILASVQVFGGPAQWSVIDITQTSWSDATGEIWVPAGQLLAYYSDVKIRYVAGFPTAPDNIVRATAQVAQNIISSGVYGGTNIKSFGAGDTRLTKFGATAIDDDVRRLLQPYRARMLY